MTKQFKTFILILPIIIIIGGLGVIKLREEFKPTYSMEGPHIQIGNAVIEVEVADEFDEWVQGLSDRPSLPANTGLLFLFPGKQVHSFWMKNMHFPLDIIWIDGDRVVNISKDLPPEGETPDNTYSSVYPVNNVLEVNAGWVEAHGVGVGDKVKYSL